MSRGCVNSTTLIGFLGQDPELRYTPNGNPVTSISLATDESYKDRQTGQLVPKTEWHRVVVFGKRAEVAGKYLKKGSKVYFRGKLQTRKWQDQGGQDRYSTEIVVDMTGEMEFMDRRDGGPQQQGVPSSQSAPAGQQQYPSETHREGYAGEQAYTGPVPDHDLDDIPF